VIQALLLDAVARDALGDHETAERDIERGLDIAEPDALVFPFLAVPTRALLERHPRHRTAHATLLADLLSVLGGSSLPPRRTEPTLLSEPLSDSELRVLRFLPSNLTAPEIAAELFVSTSTVKTHMRHIYEKLDAHRRTEAVERARELGVLGPSSRGRR
jgi:LuxR family maltose regulon positive regulatory protein